jgi:hypothetical protein
MVAKAGVRNINDFFAGVCWRSSHFGFVIPQRVSIFQSSERRGPSELPWSFFLQKKSFLRNISSRTFQQLQHSTIMSELNPLLVKSFTFDGEGTKLKLTAKQYTARGCDNQGLTLLFAHCVGSRRC